MEEQIYLADEKSYVVSICVLILSREENPSMLLRLWVLGVLLAVCGAYGFCVCVEYKKRLGQRILLGSLRRGNSGSGGGGGGERWSSGNSSSGSDEGENRDYSSDQRSNEDETSIRCPKKLCQRMCQRTIWTSEQMTTFLSLLRI